MLHNASLPHVCARACMCVLKIGSYISLAGLKPTIQLWLALNSRFFSPHLLHTGITGVCRQLKDFVFYTRDVTLLFSFSLSRSLKRAGQYCVLSNAGPAIRSCCHSMVVTFLPSVPVPSRSVQASLSISCPSSVRSHPHHCLRHGTSLPPEYPGALDMASHVLTVSSQNELCGELRLLLVVRPHSAYSGHHTPDHMGCDVILWVPCPPGHAGL